MPSLRRVAIGLAFAGLVALGGLLYLADRGLCGNTVVAEYPSPDGLFRVVVFQRDCGATTGFSTQASLLKTDVVLPNEAGNLFIADTDHGAAPAAPWGGPVLDVSWEGRSVIVLRRDPRARVFLEVPELFDVTVRHAFGEIE